MNPIVERFSNKRIRKNSVVQISVGGVKKVLRQTKASIPLHGCTLVDERGIPDTHSEQKHHVRKQTYRVSIEATYKSSYINY